MEITFIELTAAVYILGAFALIRPIRRWLDRVGDWLAGGQLTQADMLAFGALAIGTVTAVGLVGAL